jgi:uncharacterized Fe-S cluster-containing radical SAM superfamily protein
MTKNFIETDTYSEKLRGLSIKGDRFLISRVGGSRQEQDLSEPVVCDETARIRHFHRATAAGWPENPLPIDPCARKLGIQAPEVMRALVYQNAACNWRCWYCYVPFELLAADESRSSWLSAQEMVDLYLETPERPRLIDLSGGQPDLVPEWTLQMMRALTSKGVERDSYLWSDDNLSNDYFWRHLSDADRAEMASYENYGRVCCFKGFDAASFSFNTAATPELFDRQFGLFDRLLTTGFDLYAYVTLTSDGSTDIAKGVCTFVDRLQALSENLPLRTIPLEIREFSPVVERKLDKPFEELQRYQSSAIEAWNEEIDRRFSGSQRGQNIVDVAL